MSSIDEEWFVLCVACNRVVEKDGARDTEVLRAHSLVYRQMCAPRKDKVDPDHITQEVKEGLDGSSCP